MGRIGGRWSKRWKKRMEGSRLLMTRKKERSLKPYSSPCLGHEPTVTDEFEWVVGERTIPVPSAEETREPREARRFAQQNQPEKERPRGEEVEEEGKESEATSDEKLFLGEEEQYFRKRLWRFFWKGTGRSLAINCQNNWRHEESFRQDSRNIVYGGYSWLESMSPWTRSAAHNIRGQFTALGDVYYTPPKYAYPPNLCTIPNSPQINSLRVILFENQRKFPSVTSLRFHRQFPNQVDLPSNLSRNKFAMDSPPASLLGSNLCWDS